jgi:beta-glucanase (GH16 family)
MLSEGNSELQIYTDRASNVRVSQGNLILEAHRGKVGISGTERDYSSGRIRSKHRGDWKYGRIEARAKLPKGRGIWPAIWMLPTEDRYGGWASSGEIDILEFKGHEPGKIYGSIHFGGEWPKNQFKTGTFDLLENKQKKTASSDKNFSEDFHRFSIEWKPESIHWFVDDYEYYRVDQWSSSQGSFPAPFDVPFHLIINLAVGGHFPGNPDESSRFPQQFLIDYVRVYQ